MTFSLPYDYLVGILLIIAASIGILFNIISFSYFRSRSYKNRNGLYFRRLYMVITLTDTAICVFVFPVINAALSSGRDGALFRNGAFCQFWSSLWSTLPQLSIYLVGVLSVSRLVVLVKPTRQLLPDLALILPAVCVFALVTTCVGLLGSHGMYGVYIRQWLGCTFTALQPGDDLNRKLTQQDLDKTLIFTVIFNIIPGSSIIPITICFCLSLYYLKKSGKNSNNISKSYKRQLEAAKTVILVTLLYIIFNIPYSGALVYRLLVGEWTLSHDVDQTVSDYVNGRTLRPTDSEFINDYFMPIVCVVCVCFNSMVNPVVYFCRIKNFRNFVKHRIFRPAVLRVERSFSKDRSGSREFPSRDLASRDLG